MERTNSSCRLGEGWGGGGGGITHFSEAFIHEKVSSSQNDELTQQDGKSHARDQRDKAITCVFCRDLH